MGPAGRTLPVDAVQISSASSATRSELSRPTVSPTQLTSCWSQRQTRPSPRRLPVLSGLLPRAGGPSVLDHAPVLHGGGARRRAPVLDPAPVLEGGDAGCRPRRRDRGVALVPRADGPA